MASQTLSRSHLGRHLWLLAAGIGLLAAAPAGEAAVTFSISSVELQTGAGYGKDKKEKEEAGILLEVDFKTTFASKTFALDLNNPAFSFDLGTVRLAEPDSHGGILPAETDDLGLSWIFHFAQPTVISQPVTVTAVAKAEAGFIRDSGHYWVDWSPLTVELGSGLSFRLSLTDLQAETKKPVTQTATITLLGPPPPSTRQAPPPTGSVPVPGTIALFSLGLAGVVAARRKKPAR